MLDTLRKHLSQINEIMEIEFNSLKLLEVDNLGKFRLISGFDLIGYAYHNESNIILTEQLDYDNFIKRFKESEEIIKLEMEEFNCHLYVIRFLNVKQLINILK